MITAMRSKAAKVVTYFFVFLLILGFIAWGVGDVLPTGGFNPLVVAKVGKTEISPDVVNMRYRDELNRLRGLFGNVFDAERAKALGLANNVLNTMVTRELYNQGAKSLGLLVSDQRIRNEIQNDKNFKNALGEFDRIRFQEVLRSNSFTEGTYIQELRTDLARDQLLQSLNAGMVAPKALSELIYNYREEKRLAAYVRIEDATFKNVKTPTQSDLEKYYKDNPKAFTAPEYRKITYVLLRADELAKEIAVTDEAIRKAYDNRQDEFITPEKRSIQQILFADEKKAKDAAIMLKTGKDFAKVAKETAGLEKDALDLGTVSQSQLSRDLSPAAASAVFKLGKDKISNPVKSLLGWHLIKVTKIEPGSQKKLEDVKDKIKLDLAKEQAIDSLFKLANKLEDALAGGANLEEATGQLNFKVKTIPAMDSRGRNAAGEPVKGLPKEGNFVGIAFSTNELEESQLTESGTDGYFILRVDKITKPALKPMDRVRTEVAQAVTSQRQADAAKKKAQILLDEAKTGTAIDALAEKYKMKPKISEPFTRTGRELKERLPTELIEKLFKSLPGDAVMARAYNGYIVARLKDIKPANMVENKNKLDNLSNSLSEDMQNDLLTQLANGLRTDHPVTINQRAIDQIYNPSSSYN